MNAWPEEIRYGGSPCERRCMNCPDPDLNGNEHHWTIECNEQFPEGRYHCKHCEAVRDIPIDNDDFLEAFPI